MVTLLAVVLILLVGPLAALYGVDSRLPNDGWKGWPGNRR
jgi:hypothetical protein